MTDVSWVDGFHKAVALYLLHNDNVDDLFSNISVPSYPAAHILECGIAAVTNVDQEVENVSVFDTFDSNCSRPAAYISAEITCNCGEYEEVRINQEATLGEVMYGVLHAND